MILLFNKSEILERLDNDLDFVTEIVDEALENLLGQLNEVRELCQGNDTDTLRRVAHTIKGVAANISTDDLRDIACRIEAAAKDEDMESARKLLPELDRTFRLTAETIKSVLAVGAEQDAE